MGAPAEEFGPYLVYEQIGLGGMATVHRAETKGIAGFSKQVALKRMLPSVASDASLVQSFIREARLASHLRHANVAQTYDLGKVGETYFIAMELVPGRNLRELLRHCAAIVGHMPLPIAMNIVNQICDALDYAHNLCDESGQPLGIIHRDVSPSNIIVGEGGVVKLIDFGIAKASGRGMATQSGTIKGKFGYMAPEYLMGSIDARADLFALGVIAHELLSNKPLFQGKDDMDTLYRVKDMPILPPSRFNPKVPPELDAIIMTALDRNPEQRWQRAHALHTALTTEIQRLGIVCANTSVIEWVEWAFAQKKGQFDEESQPMISISSGTVELPAPPPKREVKRAVPDDFSSIGDSIQTVVKPPSERSLEQERQLSWSAVKDAPSLRSGADDWAASGELTRPASDSLDKRIGEATKLLRPSSQQRAQTPPADLLDTNRDVGAPTGFASDGRSSRNVIQRKTPPPMRAQTPIEDRATQLADPSQLDDDTTVPPIERREPVDLAATLPPPGRPVRPTGDPDLVSTLPPPGRGGRASADPDLVSTLPPPGRGGRAPADPDLVSTLPPVGRKSSLPPSPDLVSTLPPPGRRSAQDAAAERLDRIIDQAATVLAQDLDPVPAMPAHQQRTLLADANSLLHAPRADRPSQPPQNHNAGAFMIAPAAGPTPGMQGVPPAAVPAPLVPASPTSLRTLPGQGAMSTPTPTKPPSNPVLSGQRTNLAIPRAGRPSDPIVDDLSARGERPAARQLMIPPATPTIAKTRVEMTRRGGASNFLLALLVLIAAGVAAAVVYFALPYLT